MEYTMSKRKVRQFTPQQKVAIVREHLLEKKSVADVCDAHGLRSTMYYRWQKQFFEEWA
jgi:transposase-like protein